MKTHIRHRAHRRVKHPVLVTAGIWLAVIPALCFIAGTLRPIPLLTFGAISAITVMIWMEVNEWRG
ncbi:hypothetical protein [Tautonia plasticadhaerens]|uniref:Uncharacterized protein n=1 Tax=Tautonia plasticadhaerens TaxID=2527974 RepID=A0A518H2E9_9BACT|nr:hypothetical protein [Tautonia plasticadhaerens]QDV35004.1 hypothetical protein ElP_29010 [Tautonia plasticadhaerens]